MAEDTGASPDGDRATRPADQAPAGLGDTASVPCAKWRECPFDTRLARTPYLVLPKLALQAMPFEWRDRFEAMLQEMDDAGLETPSYIVLRDERPYAWPVYEDGNEWDGTLDRVEVYLPDPWANYRHGDAFALSRQASGMSAFGQDPKGLEAKPASPTGEAGDAQKEHPMTQDLRKLAELREQWLIEQLAAEWCWKERDLRARLDMDVPPLRSASGGEG